MKKKLIALSILVVCVLLFQSASAGNIKLPDGAQELIALQTAVLQKLCNTDKNIYPLGLGEYNCPEDIAPGSYIIYIFSNHTSMWDSTGLIFTDSNGEKATVEIGKLSMSTIKITVKEGSKFSLYEADGHFGVVCYIAPWTKIGE